MPNGLCYQSTQLVVVAVVDDGEGGDGGNGGGDGGDAMLVAGGAGARLGECAERGVCAGITLVASAA